MAVPDFVNGEVDLDTVSKALKQHGACIIRKVANAEEIEQINRDIRPWLDASLPAETFWPKETKRAFGLMDKSETLGNVMLFNEIYHGVCDRWLTRSHTAWMGKELQTNTSRPAIGSATSFAIGPGAPCQVLHRDDMVYQNKFGVTTPEDYTVDREIGVQCFLAGTHTTVENGATRVIPGSHLMNYNDPPDESRAVQVLLEAGDGFLMMPSCYHGGGANLSNEERVVYNVFMIGGLYRQEENQFLAIDPKWATENLSVPVLKLMGYDSSSSNVGYVDYANPMDKIIASRAVTV